ncbi:XrtN system VIT domain-containing protein [Mucilaginibacter terrenus]|uniref:XrtN system VIT domain-containing protein n=1 Tax=Mucilaginibacter terrenus TaxID=2482727 RepID=A0A3E2NXJ6_9SPHI|nr:XrtN system VIT domain-containing protein [Mucilaginibacter terrenus]RFZ85744.1 XrtN system VIT domain-containing protein [Mucilaginibacter terrenus]
MKKIVSYFWADKFGLVCIGVIIASFGLFLVADTFPGRDNFGKFFANYIISILMSVAVFSTAFKQHRWHLSKGKAEYTAYLLVIWFISAFALNREMNVFEDSTDWLCIWIVVSSLALTLAARYKDMQGFIKYVVFLLLGIALALFLYYAFYLLPLYIVSIVGMIAIGISFHTYIPMLMAIVAIRIIIRAYRDDKRVLYAAVAGFAVPVVIAGVFLFYWGQASDKINFAVNQNTLNEGKLPTWVAVSRQLERTPVTERIMKAGLVYHEVSPDGNLFWGGFPTMSFDAKKEHDPLVVLATLFFEKPNLDESDQINILKAMYNSRHQAQERLWSGDQLQTVSVISNVKLFPEYRFAYTEKTLTLRNNSNWEWNNQEAIYTFHMPEGSVVSSLSLWINGREEKSRLTTKAKADTVYKTIVGVEQHDPSVVHWQEGNTVSVRVFPCTTKENRRFRIGITSPLRLQGKRLLYENTFFEGPDARTAVETLQLCYSNKPADLQIPSIFKQSGVDLYSGTGTYQPEWELSCDAPALSATAFSFAGQNYKVSEDVPAYEAFEPKAVYLDVNSAWTEEEFKAAYRAAGNQPVYVYYDKLVRLTDENADELFQLLRSQNFSLFPFSQIKEPATALVITKSDGASPNLTDLDGSGFANELTSYLKEPRQVRVFNIGTKLTPYLKALKEMRVFNYSEGAPRELFALLNNKQFTKSPENDFVTAIAAAGFNISKTEGSASGQAPDHLLRLFAYNDIMKKVGPEYFKHGDVDTTNVAEAEQAYIVSPVSSMIVLETQEDYKRFGIDENKDSLKNASMKSSGAAPEPQEWLLIILGAAIVATFIYRSKKAVPQL